MQSGGHNWELFCALAIILQTLKSFISLVLKTTESAESSKYAKISTHELVQNAEITKFDTRENKYIYSIWN